ncbi:MAG: hypothetical protein ABI777_03395 [Betaproteobacteria bacterium]
MTHFLHSLRGCILAASATMTMSMFLVGGAMAATPTIDDKELTELGFKVLVATTEVQQKWVKAMSPGKIRPMQRNGKKFFIYPDAPKNQIYVGGPNEYAAFRERHPASIKDTQAVADKNAAYRIKQDQVMRKATTRDLSDPFLGISWFDLGY